MTWELLDGALALVLALGWASLPGLAARLDPVRLRRWSLALAAVLVLALLGAGLGAWLGAPAPTCVSTTWFPDEPDPPRCADWPEAVLRLATTLVLVSHHALLRLLAGWRAREPWRWPRALAAGVGVVGVAGLIAIGQAYVAEDLFGGENLDSWPDALALGALHPWQTALVLLAMLVGLARLVVRRLRAGRT